MTLVSRDRSLPGSSPATDTGDHEFIAIVLYESSSPAEGYTPLYNELILGVWASNRESARRRVEEIVSEPTIYANEAGEVITWQLRRIVDVAPVLEDRKAHARTLYSRHVRDIAAYERFEPLLGGTIDT